MATHKRLGVYWGEKGISLVESGRDTPLLSAFVPFEPDDNAEASHNPGISSDLRILEALQKTIHNNGFSTLNTHVALPSKDILIRSFIIPWMKSSEIHGSVAFEAQKYIPFNLNEIAYTYYPTTVVLDNIKQIGIVFVAIRKVVLSKYTNVFIQSGLNVVCSEPAAMSLLRILVYKRLINLDQNTAILNVFGSSGELIIAYKGHVKFIRDFKINTDDVQMTAGDIDDVLRTRIFNEVRISFEFFSRQSSETGVDKLITLSSGRSQAFWTGLNEEAGVPLEIVDSSKLFSMPGLMDIEGANAFGASMSGDISSVIDFNLFEDASTQVSLKKEEILKKNRKLILPILLGIVTACTIGLVFYFSGLFVNGLNFQIKALMSTAGNHMELSVDEIDKHISNERHKLKALQSLPLNGRISPLIIRLIKRMPKEMTLDSILLSIADQDGTGSGRAIKIEKSEEDKSEAQEIKYTPIQSTFSLEFDAKLHISDANIAFNEANRFINNLRKDDLFFSKFQKVTVSSLKSQTVDKKKVTTLKIVCEGK